MAFRKCVISRSENDSCTSHQGKYLGLHGVQEKGIISTQQIKTLDCSCGNFLFVTCTPGYSQKNWMGVCGFLSKTVTLFMIKICDYPIYDLTKTLKPIT